MFLRSKGYIGQKDHIRKGDIMNGNINNYQNKNNLYNYDDEYGIFDQTVRDVKRGSYMGLGTAVDAGLLYEKDGIYKGSHAANKIASKELLMIDPRVRDGEMSYKDKKAEFYVLNKKGDPDKAPKQAGGFLKPIITVKKVSFGDVLDYVPSDGRQRPHKPRLGFFGTIRNALSGLFGKPEKMKKYDREMEVYKAEKFSVLEEKFGIKGLEYNKELTDPQKAEKYINEGVTASAVERHEVYTRTAEPEIKIHKEPEYNGRSMLIRAANNMLDVYTEASNDPTVKSGAEAIKEYLSRNPNLDTPESLELAQNLADGMKKTRGNSLSVDFKEYCLDLCTSVGSELFGKEKTPADVDAVIKNVMQDPDAEPVRGTDDEAPQNSFSASL